ncbi:MAG: hypothetical protein CMF39_02915 [Legionellaceae bacterium]|nr:hypothetical protein [Legionellaceae bacterium]
MVLRILAKRRTTGKVLRALNDIFAPLRRVLDLVREDDPYIDEALFKNKKNPLRQAQKLDNTIHFVFIPLLDSAIEAKRKLEQRLRQTNVYINELNAHDVYLKQPSIEQVKTALAKAPNLDEKVKSLKDIHLKIKLAIEYFANQLKGAQEILQQILDNNLIAAEGHALPIVRDIAIGRKLPKPKHDKAKGKLILGLDEAIKVDIFGEKTNTEALNCFDIAKQMVEDSMAECEKNINSHAITINQKEIKKLTKTLETLDETLNIFNTQAATLIAKAIEDAKVQKALQGLGGHATPSAT